MKLTQSQRADVLAQFMAARAVDSRITSEVVDDAKEMLEAYEAELATWPEPPPAAYGPSAQQMADGFRSDRPIPLTEWQVKALGKLPDLMSPIRNPEGIDFSKYPIPTGYTVASHEDCEKSKSDAGWAFFDHEWIIRPPNEGSAIRSCWTYLRPLRDDER